MEWEGEWRHERLSARTMHNLSHDLWQFTRFTFPWLPSPSPGRSNLAARVMNGTDKSIYSAGPVLPVDNCCLGLALRHIHFAPRQWQTTRCARRQQQTARSVVVVCQLNASGDNRLVGFPILGLPPFPFYPQRYREATATSFFPSL